MVVAAAMKYTVVSVRNNQTLFESLVNVKLAEGWILSGGVSVTAYGYDTRQILYTQALH
jgi:hypothetical protein